MMTKLWKENWDEISTQGRHTDVVVNVCLSCINYKTSYYNLYKSILLALMLTLVFEEVPLSDMITQMSMLCMKPRSSAFQHDHPNVEVVAWSPEVPLSDTITQMSMLCMKPGSSSFRHDYPNVDVVYEAQKFPFPTWSPKCQCCVWNPDHNRERTEWVIIAPVWQQ